MDVDSLIRGSIDEAVERNGQPRELATRLAAWFEALASGNERADDPVSVRRFVEILYSTAVSVNGNGGDEGEE